SPSLKEAESYFEQGVSHGVSGQHARAAGFYQQAIFSIKESLAELQFNLGQSFNELGKFKEAAEAFEEVTDLQPEHGAAHHLLGRAYNELESFGEAVESLQRAIKLQPNYADAYLSLGYAYDE